MKNNELGRLIVKISILVNILILNLEMQILMKLITYFLPQSYLSAYP